MICTCSLRLKLSNVFATVLMDCFAAICFKPPDVGILPTCARSNCSSALKRLADSLPAPLTYNEGTRGSAVELNWIGTTSRST